ncbi:MAG: UDP-N-acetylglucosamine--N-acetylmuramyl-(pentapeptide) pyrophosphoryl-undecaprenol N-acetylglucosamine transferase [Patescibacteria group bacterium]
MVIRILLTGGGSGGHIYPLVAVAEELKIQALQKGVVIDLKIFGDGELLRSVSAQVGIEYKGIMSPKWRRYMSFQNFIDIFKLPVGFFQSLFYVWRFMPDIIFSKGGYGSFLPSLAGRIFMIPLVIHESDAIPGKANLWLGKMSQKIFVSFDVVRKYFNVEKTELVGNPIRSGILKVVDRASALTSFGLDHNEPTILVTGATQGAQNINDALISSIVELTKKFQVIHQCGQKNYENVNNQILAIVKEGEVTYGQAISKNYRLYSSFDLEQMALAYSASDVVVSRAPAGSIFEIAALGKPAVIIPIKNSASNHQLANAREFSKFGAIVIEEDNLTPHILINEIGKMYDNRVEASQKIKGFAKPEAAQIIGEKLLEMIKPS